MIGISSMSKPAKPTLERARKEAVEMCKPKSKRGCEHPEKLKGKPEKCTPEQIKECHGEVKPHACVPKK